MSRESFPFLYGDGPVTITAEFRTVMISAAVVYVVLLMGRGLGLPSEILVSAFGFLAALWLMIAICESRAKRFISAMGDTVFAVYSTILCASCW